MPARGTSRRIPTWQIPRRDAAAVVLGKLGASVFVGFECLCLGDIRG